MTIAAAVPSRDRGSRAAMCRGKKAYSAYRAFMVAKRMNSQWDTKPKVAPYRCAVCGQHHVGGKSF